MHIILRLPRILQDHDCAKQGEQNVLFRLATINSHSVGSQLAGRRLSSRSAEYVCKCVYRLLICILSWVLICRNVGDVTHPKRPPSAILFTLRVPHVSDRAV